MCNILTNIDQDLGRFNSLETETAFSCSKPKAVRLMFLAQGPKIFSFILTIHRNIDTIVLHYAHRLSVRSVC